MDGAIEPALWISPVKLVISFRSLVIALPGFGSDWFPSERDFVGLEHLPLPHQHENSLAFDNNDAIRLCIRCDLIWRKSSSHTKRKDHEPIGSHAPDYSPSGPTMVLVCSGGHSISSESRTYFSQGHLPLLSGLAFPLHLEWNDCSANQGLVVG